MSQKQEEVVKKNDEKPIQQQQHANLPGYQLQQQQQQQQQVFYPSFVPAPAPMAPMRAPVQSGGFMPETKGDATTSYSVQEEDLEEGAVVQNDGK